MNSAISFGYGLMIIPILYYAVILGLIGFVIYFLTNTLHFFKQKTRHDRELLDKLDELIRLKKL
jgi:uncharacterized membrane protein